MEIKKKYLLLLSFCIPLAVMIACMAIFQVEPFGNNSFLIIDGLHQYMPFFSILYDKLQEGGSLFYSFRAGLGINFLSLFSYYLSSPLNFFILLFDKTQLNMAVSLLIVFKIALSGLTAGIYFSSKTKKPGVTVLVCSAAYALNSYMVGYCWNVMWLDAVMIFPIVILGIERLIDKKDGRLYGAALFYALYCMHFCRDLVSLLFFPKCPAVLFPGNCFCLLFTAVSGDGGDSADSGIPRYPADSVRYGYGASGACLADRIC